VHGPPSSASSSNKHQNRHNNLHSPPPHPVNSLVLVRLLSAVLCVTVTVAAAVALGLVVVQLVVYLMLFLLVSVLAAPLSGLKTWQQTMRGEESDPIALLDMCGGSRVEGLLRAAAGWPASAASCVAQAFAFAPAVFTMLVQYQLPNSTLFTSELGQRGSYAVYFFTILLATLVSNSFEAWRVWRETAAMPVEGGAAALSSLPSAAATVPFVVKFTGSLTLFGRNLLQHAPMFVLCMQYFFYSDAFSLQNIVLVALAAAVGAILSQPLDVWYTQSSQRSANNNNNTSNGDPQQDGDGISLAVVVSAPGSDAGFHNLKRPPILLLWRSLTTRIAAAVLVALCQFFVGPAIAFACGLPPTARTLWFIQLPKGFEDKQRFHPPDRVY
jgi:hypothetical protein